MMSTEAILGAAAYHGKLTLLLESLNKDAPAELHKLQSLILDLEKDILASKNELATLTTRNHKAKGQGQTLLRDSTGRRLAYTMTGRKKTFEKRAHQEEESVTNAILEELDVKEKVDHQELLLSECYTSRSRLEHEVQQVMSLTSQLDDLYDSIFAGSTIEHPEEDPYEEQVKLALATLTGLKARQDAESRTLELLNEAEVKMVSLCDHYKASLPMFTSRGKHRQRQVALEKCGQILNEARHLVIQAQSIQPEIQFIPSLPFNYAPNVYEQVSGASRAADLALKELKKQIVAEKRWIKSLESGVEQAQQELEETRKDLRFIRKTIFERIVSQGSNLPPEYEE